MNSSLSSRRPHVALLDYGSGNVRSAQRAVERAGAEVEVTRDPETVQRADGLLVPGVGAYSACMQQLHSVYGDRLIGQRLAGGRPVLGICVGMQILFDRGVEFAEGTEETGAGEAAFTEGMGEWPGTVEKLDADVLPHMGWNTVEVGDGSSASALGKPAAETTKMFAGIGESERFYFVHSYGVQEWELLTDGRTEPPLVHWASHGRSRFVAAVENGPLWATQFHPEKSGDAGLKLLQNWVETL
ncbi:imidazole glycerol phosphate synthase subunit HisH [uncultured Corynebacterium sp.]|uniref:imidazole glycerol phosphate synthase subunit HisH n=1 Tax=uncultured Corynebacterium sp. TaxID=159447 RepID=UPI0025FEA4B6|nr:imidazole glycerol phosphate synthase subunit HisH [uncultured Corynebacterium sp.]